MSWTNSNERGSLLGMRFVAWCLQTFGLRPARWLVEPVVLYFFVTSGAARRASLDYLRRVARFPQGRAALGREPGLWLVWQHFRTFGQMLLDRVCLWRGMHGRFAIEFPRQQLLLDCIASGRGAILLGAHVGSFDLLRALAKRNDRRVYLVMFQASTPKFNAFLKALDPTLESHVIRLDPSSVDSILAIEAHVSRGDWVALLADRKELVSSRRIGRAPLLGSIAELPLGPLRVASLLGCPVYTIVALKTGPQRYTIDVEQLADFDSRESPRRERDLQAWLEIYARRLESACLRAPLQWFNFYDFWGDRAERSPVELRQSDAPEHRHAQ